MSNPQTEDFDGCRRACRLAGAHTLVSGECEHAPEPEPTVSLSRVYTAGDGHPAIGFDTYTEQQLADLIEPDIGSAELAWVAAHAIVHRHEPSVSPAVSVTTPPTEEPPCCSDPTCTCNQVNAAGRCDCAKWDSAPAAEAPEPEAQAEASRQPDTETPPAPIGPHLRATIASWAAAQECAEQIRQPDLPAALTNLAELWERMADQSDAAIGHFEGPAAATLNAEVAERGGTYRQAAADVREVLRTGCVPHDLLTGGDHSCAQSGCSGEPTVAAPAVGQTDEEASRG